MSGNRYFADLFERYQKELRRFVALKFNTEEADDIVQDAFINMLRSDRAEEIENPRAYLYQSAHNLAINRIRRSKRHDNYVAQTEYEEETVTLERTFCAEQDLHRIQARLGDVPAKYQITFLKSRVEGLTYPEIAEELGISVSTVEKHIIKTLAILRSHLREEV